MTENPGDPCISLQRHANLRRRVVLGIAAALPTLTKAQLRPSARPMTLVAPFAPGGGGDAMIRFVASRMSAILERPVVVENKPGAGAVVAASQVARTTPDGSTLLVGSGSAFTITPHLNRALPYDVFTDFVHISPIAKMPNVLIARTGLEASTVEDLIALAKRKPGSISYASYGIGSPSHLVLEQLKRASGIDLLHVPYKGGAEQVQALLSGQVDVAIDTLGGALPRIKGGQVKALAVAQPQRTPLAPAIRSFGDSGYPGIGLTPWMSLAGPSRLPPDMVEGFSRAMQSILDESETLSRYAALAAQPWFLKPAPFLQALRIESDQLGELIRTLKISM